MSKNDDFKRGVESANYYFVNGDYFQCAEELKKAGGIVLKEIKKENKKRSAKGKFNLT